MSPTLFISDLHLDPQAPQTLALFEAFCDGPAREANRLYVLGDLFETWVGDDDDDPMVDRVAASLASLAATGVAVHLMHGNRDFLIGGDFAGRCGAELLDDPVRIRLPDGTAVLSHGDALCTDDEAYMKLRTQLRDPATRSELLDRPLQARRALAAELRTVSRAANANKPEHIMDVNDEAVAELLARFDARRLIHGHTHRPGVHHEDGFERYVLGAWEIAAVYARADAAGIVLETFAPSA